MSQWDDPSGCARGVPTSDQLRPSLLVIRVLLQPLLHPTAGGLNCLPGQGVVDPSTDPSVKTATCKACGFMQVSPGGLNAVCTLCLGSCQMANADQTACTTRTGALLLVC